MSATPVERLNAALEGRYEIERDLGEGGMATVYLADDLKHERKVALKVLKPELAAVVGAERFLAEIKTTANLQHPHILPLFDSGEADSFLFYVMPYVEGESLRERLDREKQLGVQDALDLTRKIAGALDYAHGNGVVHRDIKPGNVLLSQQGEPLVADFGIALAVAQAGGGRITETGLSLGTPHYMSPEQATGDRDVDLRSDVYSLACVLYEMLAGQPPYTASTAQAILAKILTADAPSITSERRTVPAHVGAVLAQALEKLPADRFASAGRLAAALDDPNFSRVGRHGRSSGSAGVLPEPRPGYAGASRDGLVTALGATAILLGALAAWGWLRPVGFPEMGGVPFRTDLAGFEVTARQATRNVLAISPDGSQFAIAKLTDGAESIFIRPADQQEFREVPGTQGGSRPDFSPDGSWLAFQQGQQIFRIEVSGGPILPVAPGRDPHWALDETIVFEGPDNGIYQVAPSGGVPTPILRRTAGNALPHLLPDGKAVIYADPGSQGRTLMLVDVESGEVVDLGIPGSNPRYVSTGHLVFGDQSQSLLAVRFDLDGKRVTGAPATVLPQVYVTAQGGATLFAVSQTGTAIYGMSGSTGDLGLQLVIADAEGRTSPLPLPAGGYRVPRFDPEGRRIAYDNVSDEIWVYDRVSGANHLLATGGDQDFPATWSIDGRYVYFESNREGTLGGDVFRAPADGSGEAERVFRRGANQYPLSVSPDGDALLFLEVTQDRGLDLMVALLEAGDSVAYADYLRADWNEYMGVISPTGERVAYVSDESGAPEVYVRSFPEGDDQVRVSAAGGTDPRWAPDGQTVYYLNGSQVVSARVTPGEPPTAEILFEGSWAVASTVTPAGNWDVHPDGSSFVLVRAPPSEGSAAAPGTLVIPVRIVVNWFEELNRLVPVD